MWSFTDSRPPAASPSAASPFAEALVDLARTSGALEDEARLERLRGESEAEGLEDLEREAHRVGLAVRSGAAEAAGLIQLLASGGGLVVELASSGGDGAPAREAVLLRSLPAGRVSLRRFGQKGAGPAQEHALEDLLEALELGDVEALRWLTVDEPGGSGSGEAPAAVGVAPLKRLLGLLLPDRGDLLAVVAFAVATGILLLATPIAVQAVVNSVALGGALQPLVVVGFLLFVGLALAGLLTAYQVFVVEILQRRLFARLVAELTERLPRVSIDVYDKRYGPELVNRFFDVITIQKTGAGLLIDGLALVLSILVGLVVLAFYHPLLLAFDALLLLAIAWIVFGSLRRGVATATHESNAKYEMAAWLEELARHPVLFRSEGVHPWIQARSDLFARRFLEKRALHFRVLFRQIVSALALQAIASTVLLGIGGLLVIQGSLSLGQLVAAELIVTLVVGAVAKMGKHFENYYDLMAATEKVGKLLDLPVERSVGETVVASPQAPGLDLELVDVSLERRGTSTGIEKLSVTLPAGESLAISGPSGVGKNSLLGLIYGLRDPAAGAVRIDGRSVRELTREAVRRDVALIDQVEILDGTIRDNVRLGRPFVSLDEVRSALRRVGLLDRLERLPGGLDTPLNTRGWPLSDGELRCLQIARAIAGRPRLLLVSDLFLPLSEERRDVLLDLLCSEREQRWTVVVVSNDERVHARCDRVLELPAGTVHDAKSDPLTSSV